MKQQQRSVRRKVIRIADALEEIFGAQQPSKRKSNPLDTLIATLLSQNTNDNNSHRAYISLRKKYPMWEKVAAASTKHLANTIRVGGMANQKSRRIKDILRVLKKRYGSYKLDGLKQMSDEQVFDVLLSFDGVGFKTAACVLVFALGRDVFPVDTHIHRICNRLGLVNAKTPERTYEQMKAVVPDGRAYSLHINLIQFGRKVCRSKNPLCGACPLFDECQFKQKHFFRTRTARASNTRHDFILLNNI